MVDVDDPHNYERRLERELTRLGETDGVEPPTRDAIEEFVEAHRAGAVPDDDELALSSLQTYVKYLRYTAEAVDGLLLEATPDEIGNYLEKVGYRNSASYHNANISALYAFSRFHDIGWDDEWDWIITDPAKVDTDRLFTDGEVNDLLDAGDARDQVMIGVLADTGCRIGALCSFRIRDLDLEGEVPQLAFNTDAPTKTADGKVLLTWSAGHIETYLSTDHPRPDDPEAPLLHKSEQYDLEKGDDGAVSPARIRDRLKELGDDVGIARDRMKAHNFRHTAVSNWIRQGFSADEIVHRASWAGHEMLDIYDNLTDEQRNEDLAAKYGLIDDEDVATDPSEATIPCPRCERAVRRDANFCPKCRLQMSRAPALEDDVDPVTLDADASSDPEPGVPEDVWPDGGIDILEEVPDEVLLQHLLEKTDVDAEDLLDE